MLDLKNCPFCGGKATFAKTTKGWKVECEGRWGTCTINARTHYQPTKGQAVDAWNRRALQAVGPEPVAYVSKDALRRLAAGESIILYAQDRERIGVPLYTSALVATPPAEPVVEAPQPANSVRGAAERVVSFDWSSNDPDAVAAVDALRAALATKPAVKDDETVVEARKRLERAGGAMSNILYNLKQDPTFAEALRDRIAECQEEWDAALAAKEGRS